MTFASINPATGKLIRRYPAASKKDVELALARSHRAFLAWRESSFPERARLLKAIGRALKSHLDDYAALMTEEMGKPIAQARSELTKCGTLCDYYAARGRGLLADHVPAGAPAGCHVGYAPLGPILAIMPWNFPFWQVLRAALPAITAGNTVLLKHSPNVSGNALAIAGLFRAAGAPAGLFQTVLLRNEDVPAVIADDRLQGVTLTGSTGAGKIVGALAGKAMKKAVFELGGSDAYLVLADADLDHAAETCASSRLINSGQSCVCAKRFIVVAPVRRDFEARFVARMAARSVGDPAEEATDVGPLARADLREHLQRQVAASIAAGAKPVLGGHVISGKGYFYAPTVLTGVRPGMLAYHEELFGPVASVIVARDDDDAVRIANDSPYGLGSGVFSRNRQRALRVAGAVQAGQVAINDFVRSHPALPFGGIKLSGHGRELGSYGLHEFVNVKTFMVK